MHSTFAIDLVRQDSERARTRAERIGVHLAAARALCHRASGLRGLFGGCARV
jgi:hypothetical protein